MNVRTAPGVTNNFWLDALPERSRHVLLEMSMPARVGLRETVTEAETRPRVTEILATLQNDGLLELQRATLRIVDAGGLRGAACECYAIIKTQLETFEARKI